MMALQSSDIAKCLQPMDLSRPRQAGLFLGQSCLISGHGVGCSERRQVDRVASAKLSGLYGLGEFGLRDCWAIWGSLAQPLFQVFDDRLRDILSDHPFETSPAGYRIDLNDEEPSVAGWKEIDPGDFGADFFGRPPREIDPIGRGCKRFGPGPAGHIEPPVDAGNPAHCKRPLPDE